MAKSKWQMKATADTHPAPTKPRSLARGIAQCYLPTGAAICLIAQLVRAEPPFRGLGDLIGGPFDSEALAVSADGRIVVGRGRGNSGVGEAFRWSATSGMSSLGYLPGGTFFSSANGASGDGAIVVGSSYAALGQLGFRWSAETGMVPFGDTIVPHVIEAVACSIDGSVIVGNAWSGGAVAAFRWTAANGFEYLGDLPGGESSSTVRGVSADGAIAVGESESDNGTEAFVWSSETGIEGLGDLIGGEFFSSAYAVSADGSTVVGSSRSSEGGLAFRWRRTHGMESIGDLPGGIVSSAALGVSGDGSVIVGLSSYTFVDFVPRSEAFIWTQDLGMRSLKLELRNELGADVSGWDLSSARAVSANGQVVVGGGVGPRGPEAWIASLSPCRADVNDWNGLTVQDIYDFLAMWQLQLPAADFNGIDGVTVQDIFDFLAAWNAGCP